MNQDLAIEFDNVICNSCRCKGLQFLHYVWYEDKLQRICTSCVVLNFFEFYCPTCFAVHDRPSSDMIPCPFCKSYSHPSCFHSNSSPSDAPRMCSTCKDPSRLILPLRDKNGEDENSKSIDKNSSTLLLTASKIAKMSVRKRGEELDDYIKMKGVEYVKNRNKANELLLKAMGH